jgi:hypothetical protein
MLIRVIIDTAVQVNPYTGCVKALTRGSVLNFVVSISIMDGWIDGVPLASGACRLDDVIMPLSGKEIPARPSIDSIVLDREV